MQLFWKLFATGWAVVAFIVAAIIALALLNLFTVAGIAVIFSLVLMFWPGGQALGLAGFATVAIFLGALSLATLMMIVLGTHIIRAWWPRKERGNVLPPAK